jgi:hypothetical protein
MVTWELLLTWQEYIFVKEYFDVTKICRKIFQLTWMEYN